MIIMAGKKEKKGFFNNWIVRNLLLAFGIVVVLIGGAVVFLNVVTKHNQELLVPDFTNLSVEEAALLAEEAGMRVEVTDSVFVKRMQKGAVYRQNPAAGDKVKSGRRIVLTINAVNAKKLTMPNLIGYSMRQAKAEILSRGLVLGKLIYVPDMATNNVLKQLYKGEEIEPGTQIESESVIDLVVGLNNMDNRTYVPDVYGLKNNRAVEAVQDHSLNVKSLRFDTTVRDYDDSLDAVVYRQVPEPSDSISVGMGSDVVLYLTVDKNKVPVRVTELADENGAEVIKRNDDIFNLKLYKEGNSTPLQCFVKGYNKEDHYNIQLSDDYQEFKAPTVLRYALQSNSEYWVYDGGEYLEMPIGLPDGYQYLVLTNRVKGGASQNIVYYNPGIYTYDKGTRSWRAYTDTEYIYVDNLS